MRAPPECADREKIVSYIMLYLSALLLSLYYKLKVSDIVINNIMFMYIKYIISSKKTFFVCSINDKYDTHV